MAGVKKPSKKSVKKPVKLPPSVDEVVVPQPKKKQSPLLAKLKKLAWKLFGPMVIRVRKLLARRPHRSFRLTRRRDYKRSFKLPGYWSFTNYVRATLWKNKKLFGGLALTYVLITIVISGFGAQETYANLSTTLKEGSGDLFKGNWGSVGQASVLLVSTITTGLSPDLSQAQSILGGLAAFFGWLATIWLLRNTLAGHSPRLRDGLYNSGSPVIATVLVGFIVTLQLLPAAFAVIIYSAAQASGLLDVGVSAMLVWSGVVLLAFLSIYWISSSFIALVIVTLPGMYPLQAVRTAGDLVIGRRLRMLFRLIWLGLVIAVVWALVTIPIILFDDWVKQLVPAVSWFPLVPLVIMSMGSLTLLFAASYVYLLYRRIVDDDAAPA